ncbi:MAG: hypothetical protein U0003_01120 [Vampirovibrionales bacterium]
MTTTSTTQLALATCSRLPQLDEDSHCLWRALAPRLANAGIEATPVVWNDPTVNWSDYSAVWLRSPWDYTAQRAGFIKWIDALEKQGITVWNAPDVLRWNTDKRYLNDLITAEFCVLPTAWFEGEADLANPMAFESSDVIVKPIVGASGKGMARGNWLDADFKQVARNLMSTHAGGLMVQPYCPAIETEGEVSVVYWANTISHATQKRPRSGEYRIHAEYGGTMEGLNLMEPWLQPLLEQTQAMVAWCNQRFSTQLMYARADFIKSPTGEWSLNELELTEPCLYAQHASLQSITALGKTLIQRLQ